MNELNVVRIPLSAIDEAPWNINEMDEGTFASLTEDMRKEKGLYRINPIQVRPIARGRYQLVDGHQRFRAAKVLKWKEIRAIVREDLDEDAARELNYRLNRERGKVNPIREAELFQVALNRLGSTRRVASRYGVTHTRVQAILRRLKVSELASQILESQASPDFKPSAQHYEALGMIKNPEAQRKLAEVTVKKSLPAHKARQTAQLVRGGLNLEDALELTFGTGAVHGEKGSLFTCEKCGLVYHVDWTERKVSKHA